MSIYLFYVTDQILIETEYNCTISMATAGASLPGDAGELAAEDRSESVGADHEFVSQRGPGHDVHVCLAQDPHQQSLPVLIPQLLNTPTHSGLDASLIHLQPCSNMEGLCYTRVGASAALTVTVRHDMVTSHLNFTLRVTEGHV